MGSHKYPIDPCRIKWPCWFDDPEKRDARTLFRQISVRMLVPRDL